MRWKTMFCIIPRRLAAKSTNDNGMKFVGWVWMQRAYLTNNVNHGWVAFVESQTAEYLDKCPCCKRPLKENA